MQINPVIPQPQTGAVGGNAPVGVHVPVGGNAPVGGNGQTLANLHAVTFAPMGDGDVFSHCAAINISRKAGKDFVPVVPDSPVTKVALEQGKAAMLAEYAQNDANSVQQDATMRQHIARADQGLADIATMRQGWAQSPLPPTAAQQQVVNTAETQFLAVKAGGQTSLQTIADNRAKWAKMTQAAQNTEILAPERKLSELPDDATVHLPGHGAANYPYLASVQTPNAAQRIGLKQVALKLQTAELKEDTKLKMGSCHSGDTEVRQNFVANPPSTEFAVFGPNKAAPAKTLANELHDLGVANRGVFGYQGAGQAFAKVDHAHFQRKNGAQQYVQASTVRKEFKPDLTVGEKVDALVEQAKKLID
jgi:hypothetical protein